ncbi:hypothetical protein [Pseudothauera lacus]|nr:hypothetical protein [Pseudothauera lacus]
MDGLQAGVGLVLVLAVVVLFRHAIEWIGRRVQQEGATGMEEQRPKGTAQGAKIDRAESVRACADTAHSIRTEVPRAVPVNQKRRFARQALLTNRHVTQNAFVTATILGPCRARQPHGADDW